MKGGNLIGQIRNTVQRVWILAAVKSLHNHPTMEEVFQEVRRQHPGVGRATVYRNLLQFAEEGRIRSVVMPVSPMRYDGNTKTHYHIKCRQCGEILDIDSDLEDILKSGIKAPKGVAIETYDVLCGGLCPPCNPIAEEEPRRDGGQAELLRTRHQNTI